jgi:hypothetical protein
VWRKAHAQKPAGEVERQSAMTPEWRFRAMSRGEINVDPIEGEFFTTEALGSLSDALVREAIQNSLDAAFPGERVHVIISFCHPKQRLIPSRAQEYMRGLQVHLKGENAGLTDRPKSDEPMDFMLIEDFGTRGLEGDIWEDEDIGDDAVKPKNDFFYFWRNIGRAVEGTTARGRWGLGKTVFQAASRINSFFGVTVRRTDPRSLLMGQSVLKIHRSEGDKYAPYGYYGVFEDGFSLPIHDPTFVSRFCSDFGLQREHQPGLSVIVPYPEREILPKDVIRSAILHYFFPILSQDLVVTIRDGASTHVLDARSLFGFVDRTDWSDKILIRSRLELARWSIDLPDEDYVRIEGPPEAKQPKWDEDLFGLEQLERLRKRFDRRERIALVVLMWIRRSGSTTEHGSFKVVLERDPNLERGEDHFIREGVTIAGVASLRQRGIRVLVSVTDKPLSKFLGDSENPAHTEWQERSPKFRGKYDWGPTCLRYIKNSPREILRILSRPPKGRDERLLGDLFYIDLNPIEESSDKTGRPTGSPGMGGQDQSSPNDIATDRIFQVHRTKDGFWLSRHPFARRLPKIVRLEMAYDVRQGNPFKRYRPFDFEINKSPIVVQGKGLKASMLRGNAILLQLEEPEFKLMITGFDPNRDLKIKTTTSLDGVK